MELFINTNLWMDIYVYSIVEGTENGNRAQNSNTDVDDAVTQSSDNFITEYGCDLMSTT